MPLVQTRRRFLTTLSLAGAAGLVRASPALAAEGALETTAVRIPKTASICLAPQYVGEELLRAEVSYAALAHRLKEHGLAETEASTP
jgi:NitT/TauT family transport system substrate-binding protein